ncbi:hypothetical protein F5Y09DRAFT_342991 [Xylaria sp. FL1042]|nr:hypothetical protein F5Y09DRAFT_342991 [Xylaria sp. FL1042]
MASLYDLTIPFLTNALKAQQHLLSKAEGFEVSTNDLLESRLAPDMWPLSQQIVITALHAAMFVAKVTGNPPNQINFGPASLEDAKKYLAETLKTLEGVTPESINGKEDQIIGAMMGPGNEVNMKAVDYAQGYLTPNVFFHLTTAYDILRSKGVPLGKADFLSGFVKRA